MVRGFFHPIMKIIQASFFWKNDQPGGLGFTFSGDTFTLDEFNGEAVKDYLLANDKELGSGIVKDCLAQLEEIGLRKLSGEEIPLSLAILSALNIIWLSERGFIPQDEFNGTQYVKTE